MHLQRCFLFLSVLCCLACGEDETLQLTAGDYELIDSLFKERVTAVREGVEANCDSMFEQRVVYLADSLVRERTAERERYLERIQRELQQ